MLTFPMGNYTPKLGISHSKIHDFLSCPRAYFLKYIYKDPKTGKKINLINPPLALGNAVHEVFEIILEKRIPPPERAEALMDIFNDVWNKVSGEAGGFKSNQEELEYKNRGISMISRAIENPGPLVHKAVVLPEFEDGLPPRISLSDSIIVSGKVDWLEYVDKNDSIHIIDFKTGEHDERPDSLQLPIYYLLVKNLQKRSISKVSYWYLDREDFPKELPLPDIDFAQKTLLRLGNQIQEMIVRGEYVCPRGNGCFSCQSFEEIIKGNAKFIRTIGYQDIYALL